MIRAGIKTPWINMLKALMGKLDGMQEQMSSVSERNSKKESSSVLIWLWY